MLVALAVGGWVHRHAGLGRLGDAVLDHQVEVQSDQPEHRRRDEEHVGGVEASEGRAAHGAYPHMGLDAIMLAGETAVGLAPARVVRTLDAIIADAEMAHGAHEGRNANLYRARSRVGPADR